MTDENAEFRLVLHVAGDAKDRQLLLNELADTIQDLLKKAYPATVHLVELSALGDLGELALRP